jgi:sulfatase modifying factor 1
MKMKSVFMSFTMLMIVICAYAQQYDSFKDPRDDKIYKTVKIGTQTWMAENLNVSTFRNGDPVPEAQSDEEWVIKKAAWCYYKNDPKNGEKYGKLYNWSAVKDPRGLAPEGWHIPSGAEWNTLSKFLGGIAAAGTKMRSKTGWDENGGGTNSSGFSGLPGSLRYDDGQFNDIGRMGYWWCTTSNEAGGRSHNLALNNTYLGFGASFKDSIGFGFSVRCVMDVPGATSGNKNISEIQTTKTETKTETTTSSIPQNQPIITWSEISAGTFAMGSPDPEDWQRQIKVTLSAFKMSKYEITFDQYDAFCEATKRIKPGDNGWGRGNHPVINVSWDDARAFANWMGCRMPTEAEWEYACRAGTITRFNTGDSLTTGQSNFNGKAEFQSGKGEFRGKTLPVGSFTPNAWGLYDMHGNVREWCSDWYGDYSSVPVTNPQGPINRTARVIRGGSWNIGFREIRSFERDSKNHEFSSNDLGFRLVADNDNSIVAANKNSLGISTTKTVSKSETITGGKGITTVSTSSTSQTTTINVGKSLGTTGAVVPTLTTKSATNVLVTTATSGGNISSNGGNPVTASGVCWGKSPNPTITGDDKTVDVPGTNFTSNISGLTTFTRYYVRAYATNSAGTGYGNELSFTTLVVDYDGNYYHFVAIGTQIWLVENLRTTHYKDGTSIPNITGSDKWFNLTTGAWCNYKNDVSNAITYSHLYNWYAATDSHNICPTAWHVPSDAEWTELTNNLGGESVAGGKIKSKSGWDDNGNGTNSSGFTALPGGYREDNYNSECFYIGSKGYFWSSTQYDNARAWYRELRNAWGGDPVSNEVYKDVWGKSIGYSIRCVSDSKSQKP